MVRTVVISDVQGNGIAFEAAVAEARAVGFDRLVLLGDLLTYGCEPQRVLDVLDEIVGDPRTVLVLGNHDQLYLDLRDGGDRTYYDRLPDWIRESVDWTADRIDLDAFAALPWAESHLEDGVLYDHANPWAYGNWTYLNGELAEASAAATLAERGLRAGVFGHTHRAVICRYDDEARLFREQAPSISVLHDRGVALVNPGSAGQPRDRDHVSTTAMITDDGDALQLEVRPLDYDVDHALACIDAAGLQPATVQRLARYLGR